MTYSLSCVRRGVRASLPLLALPALLFLLLGRSTAQDEAAPVRLYLSDKAKDKEPDKATRAAVLRPNVQQEVFTYVKNDGEDAAQVTVQLLSDGAVKATQAVKAEGGGKVTAVEWPRADEKAKMTDLRAPVAYRLVDAKGKAIGRDIRVEIDRPSNYLEVPSVKFEPGSDGSNRLEVAVRPRADFRGPPCKVELVLRPDRIPVLAPAQRKRGVFADRVSADSGTIYLEAQNLQLTGDGNGLIFLTADGYERAFTYKVTFTRSGTPPAAERIQRAALALTAPGFADPSKPVPVRIEVDDLPRGVEETARVRAEVITGKDRGTEVAEFIGERQQKLFFQPSGNRGGLLFRPEVKEWDAKLDLSAVYGRARLRVGLFNDKNEPIEVIDKVKALGVTPDEAKVKYVEQVIVLDDTAPENVGFVDLPARVVRGEAFTVQASGDDPDSGISGVVFFPGRPTKEDKPPADVDLVTGSRKDPKEKIWSANYPVPEDQTTPLTLTVQFINPVGLRKSATVRLPVVDAKAANGKGGAQAKKKGSIAGVVMEGDRPQEGLEVELFNVKGGKEPIDKVKAGKDGKFLFKDLDPGNYRVVAAKPASGTKGEKTVVLKEGEQKKDVEIPLFR